jgi:hypothetical protein
VLVVPAASLDPCLLTFLRLYLLTRGRDAPGSHLDFDAKKAALHARFDGIARRANSRAGAFASDHRLTLYQKLRHNWRWELLAAVAVWLVSTTKAAYELLKKPRE